MSVEDDLTRSFGDYLCNIKLTREQIEYWKGVLVVSLANVLGQYVP